MIHMLDQPWTPPGGYGPYILLALATFTGIIGWAFKRLIASIDRITHTVSDLKITSAIAGEHAKNVDDKIDTLADEVGKIRKMR